LRAEVPAEIDIQRFDHDDGQTQYQLETGHGRSMRVLGVIYDNRTLAEAVAVLPTALDALEAAQAEASKWKDLFAMSKDHCKSAEAECERLRKRHQDMAVGRLQGYSSLTQRVVQAESELTRLRALRDALEPEEWVLMTYADRDLVLTERVAKGDARAKLAKALEAHSSKNT